MRVKGLVWLGIPADDYAAAVRFFGETLGLEVAFDEGNTVKLAAGNGDRIQPFAPATGTSSSAATRVPASSRCSRWMTWTRRAPSWSAAAPSYWAGRSRPAPGRGSHSGHPMGTSTAWAPGMA